MRVLDARDKAQHAYEQERQALQKAEDANHRERAAMKEGLVKAVEVVAVSARRPVAVKVWN